MPSDYSSRIEELCTIIWAPSEYGYDLESQTNDWVEYMYFVRKDHGSEFGPVLAMTLHCPSDEEAAKELERMLTIRARSVKAGRGMTREEELQIFGGTRGEYRDLLEKIWTYKPVEVDVKALNDSQSMLEREEEQQAGPNSSSSAQKK